MGNEQKFDKTAYNAAYDKAHYYMVRAKIPKVKKEELNRVAALLNVSMSELVRISLEKYTGVDLHSAD